ncbi:ABC transporter permease [Hoeflea ulvae]|uniref:ABC transporter permease n=1 Tax=Hoeflea ulvae TaxID=2983764 RepID=A0ABT3YKU2_9HYPH|nr:ABC transporter permease [Hoeflea ulvae]MCY0096389.1 ABC transporter permease [Hoeflea ulvae]
MSVTPSEIQPRTSIGAALREKRNVMGAVILRDVRSRYFNHGLGFLIVSIWPLVHMLTLLAIYKFIGRQAPYGDSLNVFFATGLIPTLSFMYVSRFMSLSLLLNRPMLAFPVVTVVDIMAARAFLEITAAVLTLCFLFSILLFLGDNPFPADPHQAAYAYLASLLLAVGVGSIAGVIVMFMPFFATVYALTMIFVYVLSGILFVPSSLPEPIAYALSWNPVLHLVEWMRTAYYLGYSDKYLDKTYVLGFGMTSLCLGLLMERVFRLRMLES